MPASFVNAQVFITAEHRRLPNGKYQGVVVQSLIGRLSSDDFEIHCECMYDTKEEAIREAKALTEYHGQSISEPPRIMLPDSAQLNAISA